MVGRFFGSGNEVSIEISADTRDAIKDINSTTDAVKKLDSQTRKSSGGVDGLAKSVGGLASGMKLLVGGAALGGVAAGLGALVTSSVRSADALNILSGQTGASVELLSELRFGAQQTGVAFDTFLLPAFRRVQRVISLAQAGGETYEKQLGRIGLASQNLAGLKPDEQFLAVADAIAQINNQADRAENAFTLFGDAGVQALPLILNQESLRQQARDIGATITGEQAETAASMVDAVGEFRAAVTSLREDVVLPLLPPLTAALRAVTPGSLATRGEGPLLGFIPREGIFAPPSEAQAGAFRRRQAEQLRTILEQRGLDTQENLARLFPTGPEGPRDPGILPSPEQIEVFRQRLDEAIQAEADAFALIFDVPFAFESISQGLRLGDALDDVEGMTASAELMAEFMERSARATEGFFDPITGLKADDPRNERRREELRQQAFAGTPRGQFIATVEAREEAERVRTINQAIGFATERGFTDLIEAVKEGDLTVADFTSQIQVLEAQERINILTTEGLIESLRLEEQAKRDGIAASRELARAESRLAEQRFRGAANFIGGPGFEAFINAINRASGGATLAQLSATGGRPVTRQNFLNRRAAQVRFGDEVIFGINGAILLDGKQVGTLQAQNAGEGT